MRCCVCHQSVTFRNNPWMDPRIHPTQSFDCLCEQHAKVFLRRIDNHESNANDAGFDMAFDVADVMKPGHPTQAAVRA